MQVLAYTTEISPAALISEWIDGPSLHAMAQRREFSVPMALLTVDGAATGLHQLHLAGLVHGTLTPSRVLVNTDAEVRLTDVGQPAIGEAEDFVAPEVRGLNSQPTRAADVYSAGRLLKFALAATTATRDEGDLLRAEDAVALRLEIARLVESACAQPPEKRLDSIEQFRDRLQQAADQRVRGWAAAGGAVLGALAAKVGPVALVSTSGQSAAPTAMMASAVSPPVQGAPVSVTGSSAMAEIPSPTAAAAAPQGFVGALAAHPIITGAVAAGLVVGVAAGAGFAYSHMRAPQTEARNAAETVPRSGASLPATEDAEELASVEPQIVNEESVQPDVAVRAAPETPQAVVDSGPIPDGVSYWQDDEGGVSRFLFVRRGTSLCVAPIPSDNPGYPHETTSMRDGVLTFSEKGSELTYTVVARDDRGFTYSYDLLVGPDRIPDKVVQDFSPITRQQLADSIGEQGVQGLESNCGA